jgi:leader peptidase (prepilin peptidase)/N-methyltransferase
MTGLETALAAALISALTALTVIDLRTYRLPDIITLPLIAAGVLAAWLIGSPVWLSALGAALGYGVLVAVEKAYERTRGRQGLGRGDAKLFAAGGAWCGALALPFILLAASVSALLYVGVLKLVTGRALSADDMIAFGPFLAFGIGLIFILERMGLAAPLGL